MAGTITGTTITSTYTLTTNSTTIASDGAVEVNSTVSGAVGILGTSGTAWTLTNLGTVESLGSLGIGVSFASGGLITNGATDATGALISGSDHGIYVRGGLGSVFNFGTVEATGYAAVRLGAGGIVTNYGSILALGTAHAGVAFHNASGSTVNFGFIQGSTAGSGVRMHHGGSVLNGSTSDTVATITGGNNGINIDGGSGNVVNFGTITATATGVSSNGVALGTGGAVTNSGIIRGSNTGVTIATNAGTVVNAGTIEGTGLAAGAAGVGVLLVGGMVTNQTNGLLTASRIGIWNRIAPATIDNFGTIQSTAPTSITSGSGVYLQSGGGFITNENGGVISALRTGISIGNTTTTTASVTVRNAGTITGSAGIRIGAFDTGNNTIDNFGGIIGTSGTAVQFGAGNDLLMIETLSSLQGVVSNVNAGDMFDLPFMAWDPSGTATTVSSNGTLQLHVVENSGTFDIALDPNDNFAGAVFQLGTDAAGTGTLITEQVACFCRGTMILTEDGEVPVEDLTIGDLMITLSGEVRPIRWIGRRAYDGRFIAGNRKVLPVRISADALRAGVPARDLFVSPQHSLYFDGVLVQADHLVNGATIVQAEDVERVEYFHIELDTHDVIFAERAPAESFVDCDNRLMFANGAEYAQLHRDDNRPGWQFCLPRLEWGCAELNDIRADLLWRATAHGHTLDPDPDLHLIVDGKIVRPQMAGPDFARFTLPADSGAVWLASHSGVPAQVDAGATDIRRLGVAITRLVLRDCEVAIEIAHSHPDLSDGFYPDEQSHRWTDGRARLPEALLRPFASSCILDVHLAESALCYRIPAAVSRAAAA